MNTTLKVRITGPTYRRVTTNYKWNKSGRNSINKDIQAIKYHDIFVNGKFCARIVIKGEWKIRGDL